MAPGSLMDDDDDEEDIGLADLKDGSSNNTNSALNFDDESKENTDSVDLISLDENSSKGAAKRKNVPKLKAPKK